MENEARDKSQSAPEKAQQKEAEVPSREDAETVTLAPVGLAFYVSEVRLPQEDGSMLVFDRNGTEVSAEDADSLIESAAAAGVLLERKA